MGQSLTRPASVLIQPLATSTLLPYSTVMSTPTDRRICSPRRSKSRQKVEDIQKVQTSVIDKQVVK